MSHISHHHLKDLGDLDKAPMFALRGFRDAWKENLECGFWGWERELERIALDLSYSAQQKLVEECVANSAFLRADEVTEFAKFCRKVAEIESARLIAEIERNHAALEGSAQ